MGSVGLVELNAGSGIDITVLLGATNTVYKFHNFLNGPFAIILAVIALLGFGILLTLGQDFQGLALKISMLLLGLAFVPETSGIVEKIGGKTDGILMPKVYFENPISAL